MARKRKDKSSAWVDGLYIAKKYTNGMPWGHFGPEPGTRGYKPPVPPPADEKPKVRRIDVTKRAA